MAEIPAGYGRPYTGGVHLAVRERRLVAPGELSVSAAEKPSPALRDALEGKQLVLEVPAHTVMGELSHALAALAALLPRGEQACLLVRDGTHARCVPFRPFGAEEFSAWLDAPRPLGKIRVVFRADGMEVVADRGKVPGPDRYGPSLPPVNGRPDFDGLDRILARMASRFPSEEQAALAPSPGLSLDQVAKALGLLSGPNGSRFEEIFLVYP